MTFLQRLFQTGSTHGTDEEPFGLPMNDERWDLWRAIQAELGKSSSTFGTDAEPLGFPMNGRIAYLLRQLREPRS